MKNTIVVLIVLCCGSLRAQNPDGRNASLHIEPTWLWGNANYNRNTQTIIPQTMVTPSQTVITTDSGIMKYPFAFSVSLMLKIPTASFLTMSVAYSYNQRFEEENEYYHYWSSNGYVHKVSFTASIYNLFSVY